LLKKLSVSLTEMAKGVRNGHPEKCLPNILNMRFPVDAFMLATTLNKEYGICVSCGSRKSSPSPVLKVLGQTDAHASQAIRISLSRHTTEEHIRFLLGCIQPAIKMALARSVS
jgi:cysteine desulfurase